MNKLKIYLFFTLYRFVFDGVVVRNGTLFESPPLERGSARISADGVGRGRRDRHHCYYTATMPRNRMVVSAGDSEYAYGLLREW